MVKTALVGGFLFTLVGGSLVTFMDMEPGAVILGEFGETLAVQVPFDTTACCWWINDCYAWVDRDGDGEVEWVYGPYCSTWAPIHRSAPPLQFTHAVPDTTEPGIYLPHLTGWGDMHVWVWFGPFDTRGVGAPWFTWNTMPDAEYSFTDGEGGWIPAPSVNCVIASAAYEEDWSPHWYFQGYRP